MNTSIRSLLAGLLLLCAGPLAAEEDFENCKDHPLFTRLPNHYIYGCEHTQFDLRRYPVGPLDKDNRAKLREVEGEVWHLVYVTNEGAVKPSGLQVQRNFQNAARQAGGTVEGSYPQGCVLELDESFKEGNGCVDYGSTLRITKGGKEYWTFVNTHHSGYRLYIVARGTMAQEVGVNELVDRLNREGYLTLYVNFDTGKATIRPDSGKTLDDAAAALKAASDLRIEVGGHTDNVGTPQANEKLSAERAHAVMAGLVARGVPGSRLSAKGYGQAAPVADNRTEDGRAKNRRVELVKK